MSKKVGVVGTNRLFKTIRTIEALSSAFRMAKRRVSHDFFNIASMVAKTMVNVASKKMTWKDI